MRHVELLFLGHSMPGGAIYLMRKRAIEKQHRKKKAGGIRLNQVDKRGFLQIGDPQNQSKPWVSVKHFI